MRKSAPRRLRNAVTGVAYAEGKDWTVAPRKHGEEVVLELAKGSAIKSGDQLLFDCFIVARGGPKSNSSTCSGRTRRRTRLSSRTSSDLRAKGFSP